MRLSLTRPRRTLAAVLATSALVVGGGIVMSQSASAACAAVDVAVARGTGEGGTLGTIVGDPFFADFQRDASGTTTSSYRVNYPASLAANSPGQGNTDLVEHVKSQASACPNQKFVLVGYSQGANVVDNSIGISSQGAVVGGAITETIPSNLNGRIIAIVVFGNPIRAIGKSITGTFQSRTDDFCANGDPICGNGNNIQAHLSYNNNGDVAAGAQFAAARR